MSTTAPKPEIYNVLFLGETGVGKSTYLNTLLNYFTYDKLSDVTVLKYFVGIKFIRMDENFSETVIRLGNDENESQQVGRSSTKYPKIYQITLPDGSILNLIDTPGLGDTQGIENDYRNVEKILEVISELESLNAICVLFKPNNSRLGVVFDYCIKNIIGQLDQAMKNNIVFLFTNGRSSFYTPGDTQVLLQKILDEMDTTRHDPIPFNQNNTFCVENDWFRYLAAKQNGVEFKPDELANYEDSWKRSSATSKRMIDYIKTLPPRRLRGMLTINECKRLIRKLIAPIGNLIAARRKDRRQQRLEENKLKNLLKIKKSLKENLITERTRAVKQTSVVHTEETTTRMRVGHDVSLIPPFYTVELNPSKQTDVYDKINDSTVLLSEKVEDSQVKDQITSIDQEIKVIEGKSKELADKIKEYQDEFQFLLTAAADFNVFLKENIHFYSMDPTEAYFQQMVNETRNVDTDEWKMYQYILRQYKVKTHVTTHGITINRVQELIDGLVKLKHSGAQLKKLLELEDENATTK